MEEILDLPINYNSRLRTTEKFKRCMIIKYLYLAIKRVFHVKTNSKKYFNKFKKLKEKQIEESVVFPKIHK